MTVEPRRWRAVRLEFVPLTLFRASSTIRSRIQLLVALSFVPMALLVLINAFATRRHERADVQQQAYRVTRLVASTQERLAETTGDLLAATATIAVDDACPAAFAAVLARTERFQNLGVLAIDGRTLCAARPPAITAAQPPGWLSAAAAEKLTVTGYADSALAPRPTVVFAQSRPGGTPAVLFAALDLAWLGRVLADVPLPPEASVNLLDDEGTILARTPDHERWVGRNIRHSAIGAMALSRPSGVAEAVGIDGVPRLYGHHKVALTRERQVIVTVGMPLETAYAVPNRHLRVNLGVLAVLAVATLLAARAMSERTITRRIESVLRAARRLSAGDLTARTGSAPARDEIGELARAFDAMAWSLERRTHEMQEMTDGLRSLAARLEAVREEERTRISREIHDELGQSLTGVRMDLDRLEERVQALPLPAADREPIDAKIRSARDLVLSTLDTSRRISRQLRPSVLDVLGLQAGIEWQLDEFQKRTGITTSLVADDVSDLDEASSVALFRILQESLTNVARHAGASAVRVRLLRTEGETVLEISDNGRGFTPGVKPSPRSIGLLGMKERASTLGGEAVVRSQPGQGTTVEVRVPQRGGPEPS